jgi:rhodanese-related sulfurtransferase
MRETERKEKERKKPHIPQNAPNKTQKTFHKKDELFLMFDSNLCVLCPHTHIKSQIPECSLSLTRFEEAPPPPPSFFSCIFSLLLSFKT